MDNNKSQTGLPNVTTQKIEIRQRTNSFGMAGFVLAVLSILVAAFSAFPFAAVICLPISILLCIAAMIFCVLGIFKTPRGLAFSGLVISFLSIIIIMYVIFAIETITAKFQQSISNLFSF